MQRRISAYITYIWSKLANRHNHWNFHSVTRLNSVHVSTWFCYNQSVSVADPQHIPVRVGALARQVGNNTWKPNATKRGLKGLCHGQKCLHLFSDSEASHEQMGPISSSNGSLDIYNRIQCAYLEPSATHLPRKLTQLLVFGVDFLHADVWKTLLHVVHIRPVVTQV